jgi:hypothetical protein
MTLAELHGKLSPDHPEAIRDRLEDLLTSDVFGTMRYAGWECGFLNWLLQAQAATPRSPVSLRELLASDAIERVEIAFWPTLPNGREPDVALLIQHRDHFSELVVVEAKYLSGTSDFAVAEGIDDRGRTGNQIADQLRGMAALTEDEIATWFNLSRPRTVRQYLHILVTKDVVLPRIVYHVAARHLPLPWPVSAYWLSWTSLAAQLTPHAASADLGRAALLGDLLSLLERKALVPYRGFAPRTTRPLGLSSFWRDRWWLQSPAVALPTTWSFWIE